jgi:hypothetical protein
MRLDKGLARTGQQEGFDESGGINCPTKEVSTDGDDDDNQKDDNQDDNSSLLVTESAMTGAASDLWIDQMGKESNGRDYGE